MDVNGGGDGGVEAYRERNNLEKAEAQMVH